MKAYTAADLQRNLAEVQRAASREPVAITVHGKPRSVMLPVEMYQQMVNASEADPSAGSKLPLPHIASLPVPIRKEIEDRYSKAVTRAGKALAALGALEIPVWVTGSLARGKFTRSSDVDFVVDATGSRRMLAALVLEEALGDLPFHIVTFESVDDDAREFSMDGALDAAQFRARLA